MKNIRRLAQSLAGLEFWLIGLGVAAGTFSARIMTFTVALGLLFWLVRWLAHGRLTVRTPADWPIGLLLLAIPFTLWATALPEVTQPQIYRLLGGVLLCYALVNWAISTARVHLAAIGSVAVGALLALTAPVSVEWMSGTKLLFIPEAIYHRLPLLVPDPIHPNVMAGALVVLLPLALALLLFAWPELAGIERAIGVTSAVLMLGVLILTKSRGGLLALAAVLAVLVLLRWRRGWLVGLAVVLVAALGTWRLGGAQVVEWLATTQSIGGVGGRLEVWSRALYMVQDFPLTGIGMGTFRQVANGMYPFFLAGPDADIPHAHNLFLQVGVDLGLPGLVAWLALFGLVCLAAWQVYRWGMEDEGGRKARPYMAGVGAGLLCSQIALVVHGLLDATTWGTRPAVIVWALWAMAMAAWNLRARPIEMGQSAVKSWI